MIELKLEGGGHTCQHRGHENIPAFVAPSRSFPAANFSVPLPAARERRLAARGHDDCLAHRNECVVAIQF
jgi:hypothetical protein